MEDDSGRVKAWLMARVGKTIAARVVQKASRIQSEQVLWRGKAKVLRCVEQGVVLELGSGLSTTWGGSVFHFVRNIFIRHVVSPWQGGRLSIPYKDLQVEQDSHTGEKCLIIDAATWNRAPTELMESAKRAEGDRRTEPD